MKDNFNIIFVGTPEFAFYFFKKIIKQNKYKIIGIITKNLKLKQNPIIKKAKKNNINNIFTPSNYKELKKLENQLLNFKIDIILIIAYGFIIPNNIIKIPKFGCINLHASLLPRWRGSSPIQKSILMGDKETGVTTIKINKIIDNGDILYQKKCIIQYNETYITLYKKIKRLGIIVLFKTLKKIKDNKIKIKKQNNKHATYAKKIKKNNGLINWNKQGSHIERQIRAFCVWPKTFFFYKKYQIIIWKIKIKNFSKRKKYPPGYILKYNKKGLQISTIDCVLNIKKLQLNNCRIMKTSELINSKPNLFKIGEIIK